MNRVFFQKELEGIATFWRIHRRDGVTLAFTSHDRDLWFDGIKHCAAPGMVPSAIRRTSDLTPDSAEVNGVLGHDSITEADLMGGRFDGAQVRIGAVDWENLDRTILYNGAIGDVSHGAGSFSAQLNSAKTEFAADFIPRTSPTCRARFCGTGCTLPAQRFTHEAKVLLVDLEDNRVRFDVPDHAIFAEGEVRFLSGEQAGIAMMVVGAGPDGVLLDVPLSATTHEGMRAVLREGCDHTLATCDARFGNAINFQGEPFLPGNDLMARYPTGR